MGRAMMLVSVLVALALIVPGAAVAKHPKPVKTVDIQILGLNDFHGQLEFGDPISSSGFRIGGLAGTFPNQTCIPPSCYPAGGVEYLSTHIKNLRATNPKNTVFVSAGDLIGATPLLSAAFRDEPTIEAFNLMKLDYNGVGNHEFDEGVSELLRMQRGGCHPVDGCQDGDGFAGAKFDFLAANVVYKKNNKPIFKPYKIHNFGHGVKVAFVGMTLEGTPLIVSPGGISTVNFLDEAETVNKLVPELKKKGADVIVVLLHEGGCVGSPTPLSGCGAGSPATINSCTNPHGALPPIVEAMDDAIDIVITGHTNWAVNCLIDGKVVTGAASQGRLITDIDLSVDRKTGAIVGPIMVNNRIVTRDVPADPKLTTLIAKYKKVVAPIANAIVGQITANITRSPNSAGESALGDVIADAQLAYTQAAGAQLAFMNPGGIRGDLTFASSSVGEGDGVVTYGEAFAVQPFNNLVVTQDMTGAQIKAVLEQQWAACTPPGRSGGATVILQVSASFTYSYNVSEPCGSRISSMKLNGAPIVDGTTYRVSLNNFIADGGDSFPAFTAGTNKVYAPGFDVDALAAYLGGPTKPIAPGPQNRITSLP
jgi:5'-nucleotidase